MALNKIYAGNPELNRDRPLADITAPSTPPTSIQPGVSVLLQGRPAMSITASGNATKTQTTGLPTDITSVTFKNGGVGNASGNATFVFDGTYEFAVTGAATSTKSDVEVFITLATGALTLTDGGATEAHYGYTDYPVGYVKEAGRAPVRIG